MRWITVLLGLACACWALMQTRMILVYMGVLRSTIVDASSQSLVRSAIQSTVTATACSLVFFFIAWPKLVTYIIAVLALREMVSLSFVGVRFFHSNARPTAAMRIHQLKVQGILIVFYGAALAFSGYFLGF